MQLSSDFRFSLMFVFFMLFVKKDFGDRLAFGIIAGIGGMYIVYYSPGVADLGPVYFYEMLIPLLILSARAICIIHDMFKERFAGGKNVRSRFLDAFRFLPPWDRMFRKKLFISAG